MSTVYFKLTDGNFAQDWSNTGLITANNDWSGVPSITGYLGDTNSGSPTGVDPRTLTAAALGAVNVTANSNSGNPVSGGVYEVTIAGDTMVALNGSGTADAPSIVLYLDFDSAARQVTLDVRRQGPRCDRQCGPADRGPVSHRPNRRVDQRPRPGYLADVTGAGATTVTHLSRDPPGRRQQPGARSQVRILTTNAVGNDELIGIDNITVTSVPLPVVPTEPGTFSINDITAAEGDSGATAFTFTVTRSNGDDGAVSVNYHLEHGTTNAADFIGATSGTVSFADGETSKTITIEVAGDLTARSARDFPRRARHADRRRDDHRRDRPRHHHQRRNPGDRQRMDQRIPLRSVD